MHQVDSMHGRASARGDDEHRGLHLEHVAASSGSTHMLQLYEDEAFYAQLVARFVVGALTAGRPAIVIATAPHRDALLATLHDRYQAPAHALASGQLQLLDAHETLSGIMDGSSPGRDQFDRVVGGALRDCTRGFGDGAVYVHGEMVDLLWRDGNASAAAGLEALWNELAREQHFHLLCTYPVANFAEARHASAFDGICEQHDRVFPTEGYSQGDAGARLRVVAGLQQRALALEAELRVRERLESELRDALEEGTRAQETVLEREQELKDCLENALEAIHWMGADGTILWANRAELEMLGYAPEEYVGRHIAEFHADADVIERVLRRLAGGEILRDVEARLRHRNGSIRHVLINSNVLWRDGEFVHTRCFTRDVTSARAAADEREALLLGERRARQDAEAANRAKSEFLAAMSHELRTPLNAIGGYVDLLELGIRGSLTQLQREDLARIQRSQRHLLGLINEVLNYTRIETGAVRYELTDVRLDVAVASVEPLILPQFQAKRLGLVIEPPTVPLVARADLEKIQQILLNLLSNAVKFTDPGGLVTVRCSSASDDTGGRTVHVHVCDTGEGIPAAKLGAVFEPFVQVHTGLTRPHDGAGLGLAISRDLARGMGGDLTVDSTRGVGSTFTLSLPSA